MCVDRVVSLAEHGCGDLEDFVHDRLGGSGAAVDGRADVQHGNATDHGITWGQFAGLGDNRPAGIAAGSARSVRSVCSRSVDGWAAGMAAPVRVHSGGGERLGAGAPCVYHVYPVSPSHSLPAQSARLVNYSYVVAGPIPSPGSTSGGAPSSRAGLPDVGTPITRPTCHPVPSGAFGPQGQIGAKRANRGCHRTDVRVRGAAGVGWSRTVRRTGTSDPDPPDLTDWDGDLTEPRPCAAQAPWSWGRGRR